MTSPRTIIGSKDEDVLMDKLATSEVGRAGSQFVFVSVAGTVRAVFTRVSDLDEAKSYARKRARLTRQRVIVESADGIDWDSKEDS